MRIGMRQEELLSYLQGYGRDWFTLVVGYATKDLNMSPSQVCGYLNRLVSLGIIERRESEDDRYSQYKVLIRLESGRISVDTTRRKYSLADREKLKKEHATKIKEREPTQRTLIAYAGAD